MKLNLKDSVLDEKGKEEFLTKVDEFTDVFSLRDEIGTVINITFCSVYK